MKVKKSRQEIDNLYILGAGASYSLSYVKPKKENSGKEEPNRNVTPLDRDFLFMLYNAYKNSSGWKGNSISQLAINWLDNGSIYSECLESAIIKRVSQFDFLSNLNKKRTKTKITNEEYLNHLIHLVTALLLGCKSNSTGNTKTFINSVFPPDNTAEECKNRIITFNYDTLIERPLLKKRLSINKIYFDRISKSKKDGIRRKPNQKFPNPLILKLHGSANWRCDREYYDKLVFGNAQISAKFPIWVGNKKLHPNDKESSLIIPPIPNKPITRNILFRHLWSTAFEYMHDAKNIIIVGYSCPYTDTLARVMFSHFKNTKIESITVVDPNADSLKNFNELVNKKYVPKDLTWKYFGSFQEYINKEIKTKTPYEQNNQISKRDSI